MRGTYTSLSTCHQISAGGAMKHKFHIFTNVSAEKKSRIESGFGKSKNAVQLIGRAILHSHIFYRHFKEQNNTLAKATIYADRHDEISKRVAAIKKEFETVDATHFTAFAALRPKSVPFIDKKIDELERLLSDSKP